MRDFKRSLRPDATNPVIIVVPDRLAVNRLKDPRLQEIRAKVLYIREKSPNRCGTLIFIMGKHVLY